MVRPRNSIGKDSSQLLLLQQDYPLRLFSEAAGPPLSVGGKEEGWWGGAYLAASSPLNELPLAPTKLLCTIVPQPDTQLEPARCLWPLTSLPGKQSKQPAQAHLQCPLTHSLVRR